HLECNKISLASHLKCNALHFSLTQIIENTQCASLGFKPKSTGMARTSYGKRSVTVVLNSQNILHNRDARFIAHGVRMTDARAEYPWVRDPSVWTSEPSETSFGVDLTVYGLEAANNYRFDTMRIDGSGAAELLILFLSTVFGVGITLLVDGARKMTEVVLDSLGQTPAEPAIQTPAPETETSAADNDKGAGI
ncbi:hypothetical protein AAFN47_25050, partial [Hoeflea sp. CAU 1731]